jgi:hypothetical protein
MSDISPYGVTQNPDAEAITANAMVGEHAGLVTGNQLAGVSAAAMFSTAPYLGGPVVPHKEEYHPQGPHGCRGKGGTCRAGAVAGTDRCVFHTPKESRESAATT